MPLNQQRARVVIPAVGLSGAHEYAADLLERKALGEAGANDSCNLAVGNEFVHAVGANQKQIAFVNPRGDQRGRADGADPDHARRIARAAAGRMTLSDVFIGLIQRNAFDRALGLTRSQSVNAAIADVDKMGFAEREQPYRRGGSGARLVGEAPYRFAHFCITREHPSQQARGIANSVLRRLRAMFQKNAARNFTVSTTAYAVCDAAENRRLRRWRMQAAILILRLPVAGLRDE